MNDDELTAAYMRNPGLWGARPTGLLEVAADAWLEGAMVASRRFAGEGVNPADWDQGNPYRNTACGSAGIDE